jgi:hypothetical protein
MHDRLLSKRAQGAQAEQTGREEGQRRRLGHRLIDYIGYGRQRRRSRRAARGVDILSDIDLVRRREGDLSGNAVAGDAGRVISPCGASGQQTSRTQHLIDAVSTCAALPADRIRHDAVDGVGFVGRGRRIMKDSVCGRAA